MIFKYLLVLLLVLPVWVEKRTYNTKVTPKVYGPAYKIGAIYVENGKSINLVDFTRKGSWINIRSPFGFETNFLWGDNGTIEIMSPPDKFVQVKANVFAGLFSLSSIDGLTFSVGDGIEDVSMEFSGRVDNVNAALQQIAYIPPTQDPSQKTITGCLAIDVDEYNHENQAPVLDLSDIVFTK